MVTLLFIFLFKFKGTIYVRCDISGGYYKEKRVICG